MNKRKRILVVLMILTFLGLGVSGVTYARYFLASTWDYYLNAKKFYFRSDFLADIPKKNVNNFWDGGSVSFNLKNYLNEAKITNKDISYRVTCEIISSNVADATCQINNNDSYTGVISKVEECVDPTALVDVSGYNETECQSNGYRFELRPIESPLSLDIINNTNEALEEVVVRVVATSNSPYQQVLNGEFRLHKSEMENSTLVTSYQQLNNLGKLRISNLDNSNKCLHILWNASNLRIDVNEGSISNYYVNQNGDVNEIRINVSALESNVYVFYLGNTGIYNISSFNISEEDCSN